MGEETIVEGTGTSWRDQPVLLLARAAHPRLGLAVTAGLTLAAAASGRPLREVALVAATVALGQTILGWHNDLVDRELDAKYDRAKPLATGGLDPGNVWFLLACLALVVVPVAFTNGLWAGIAYLLSLALGMLGNYHSLRRGLLSWLPWVAAFALYPAFISYGGWAGETVGGPPDPLVVVLAGLVGLAMHLLTGLWGLVPDNEEGWRHIGVRLGLRFGAGRLWVFTVGYLVVLLVAIGIVAAL